MTSTIDEKRYVQVTTFVTRSSCCNVTNCHERTQNILQQCYTKRENGREWERKGEKERGGIERVAKTERVGGRERATERETVTHRDR